jgi:hypothetical protein
VGNKLREQKCRDCPTIVLTMAREGCDVVCHECRKKHHSITDRARYERNRRSKPDPDCYLIISDPDKIGGFPRGSELNREEIRYML